MRKSIFINLRLLVLSMTLIVNYAFIVPHSFANSFGSMLSGIEAGAKSTNSGKGKSGDSVPLRSTQNNTPTPPPATQNSAKIVPPNSSIDFDTLVEIIESSAPGQAVLVNFYASWCGPCVQELPHLIQLRKDFPEHKLMMIGVSLDDSPATMKSFNSKVGINYPTYHDKYGNMLEEFGVNGIPFNIVFDPDLEVVYHGTGYMNHAEFTQIARDATK